MAPAENTALSRAERRETLIGHASYHRGMSTPQTSHAPRRFDLLAWFTGWSILTLLLGGWFTAMGLNEWYETLEKPPFQPPSWAFTPAWFTIFTLLTIATWRVARHPRRDQTTMTLYGVQLALNAAWSLLFFTFQRPDWALVEILALDAVVLALAIRYLRIDRLAGVLLAPYVVWLVLATAINAWIVQNTAA